MTFLATTRVAILRGTATNGIGDDVDDNTASEVAGYEDLPASLIETSRGSFDPSTGTWRSISYVAGRLPGNVVINDGDRLRDSRTGTVYIIDERVEAPRSLSGQSSVTLKLIATSS